MNGRKVFISGGDIARYISVFAALDGEGYDSWTCFLVDSQSQGFKVARCEMKMGMRASGAAELEFIDCFVPDNRVVGGLRNGWGLARATLNLSRLPVAAMAVGFAQQAVDIATAYACEQTLAGRPLIHYQQVQATIADLQAETSAIRALVWQQPKAGHRVKTAHHCVNFKQRIAHKWLLKRPWTYSALRLCCIAIALSVHSATIVSPVFLKAPIKSTDSP